MTDFNKGWSVVSVFNPYGMYRYTAAMNAADGYRRPLSTRRNLNYQCAQVANVADCIRSLGYKVCYCWTEENRNFVISSIQKGTVFYYGSREREICNHCPFEHRRSYRYLAGYRTIYQEVDNKQLKPRTRRVVQETVHMPARRLQDLPLHRLENISEEIPLPEMKELIDNGCISNMYNEGSSYVEGVSTIGNTLPPDIVEALKSFRSDDDHFVEEPDYEFYIPDSMKELPEACAAPEDSGGGAPGGPAAVAAAVAAVVAVPSANHPSKNTSSSSDSDSSDSEDD
jgi:hypothetical protein